MRLSEPRITPLTEAEWTDEQRELLDPYYREGEVYNVLGTVSRHWEAAKKLLAWGYHVLGETYAPTNIQTSEPPSNQMPTPAASGPPSTKTKSARPSINLPQ